MPISKRSTEFGAKSSLTHAGYCPIRFRSRRVALVADIEKAFLQIELDECDRDVVQFIWVEYPMQQPY